MASAQEVRDGRRAQGAGTQAASSAPAPSPAQRAPAPAADVQGPQRIQGQISFARASALITADSNLVRSLSEHAGRANRDLGAAFDSAKDHLNSSEIGEIDAAVDRALRSINDKTQEVLDAAAEAYAASQATNARYDQYIAQRDAERAATVSAKGESNSPPSGAESASAGSSHSAPSGAGPSGGSPGGGSESSS
jgi:hypothetical protein